MGRDKTGFPSKCRSSNFSQRLMNLISGTEFGISVNIQEFKYSYEYFKSQLIYSLFPFRSSINPVNQETNPPHLKL
jgi:hypothetical protein